MQTQQTPQVLAQPFCAQGDKNTIPNAATGSNLASLQEGFPTITGLPVSQGGIPPERQDFNGIMNLNSQFYFAFQNGWLPTFSQDVSNAIGGYPQGAVLWYQSSDGLQILQSAIPNNTNNFVTTPSVIGTSWTVVGATLAAIPNYFYTQIANCITQIPQVINLSLSSGTLTLNSGSTAYSGSGRTISISQNLTTTYTGTDSIMIFVAADGSSLIACPVASCSSGTSDPQTADTVYYNTSTNVVNYYAAANTPTAVSLPIAICTATGQISSIDQVFNGFGYIGRTRFILPGVELLCPNGRNADGSLNNSKIVNNALDVYSFNGSALNYILKGKGRNNYSPYFVQNEQPSAKGIWYSPAENIMRLSTDGTTWTQIVQTVVGTVMTDAGGSITEFSTRPPFRAVDYSEIANADYVIDTYSDSNGNWYRVYKSGWVEQGGMFSDVSANPATISLLKAFANTNYTIVTTSIQDGGGGLSARNNVGATGKTTTSFKVYGSAGAEGIGMLPIYWQACGQGA